jgi:hypothetical protein
MYKDDIPNLWSLCFAVSKHRSRRARQLPRPMLRNKKMQFLETMEENIRFIKTQTDVVVAFVKFFF